MTQEEKELLLIDLSARLPYSTKVRAFIGEKGENDEILGCVHIFNIYAHDCKPYLRPMSSMTEEEYEQYRKFSYYGAAGYRNNDYKEMVATPSFEKMDFLNAHHFDYRGLIEKGLAIEAPEGMYNV